MNAYLLSRWMDSTQLSRLNRLLDRTGFYILAGCRVEPKRGKQILKHESDYRYCWQQFLNLFFLICRFASRLMC